MSELFGYIVHHRYGSELFGTLLTKILRFLGSTLREVRTQTSVCPINNFYYSFGLNCIALRHIGVVRRGILFYSFDTELKIWNSDTGVCVHGG